MNGLSELLDKEVIDWPTELKPICLLTGDNQIGESWKVECSTETVIKSLKLELKKRRKQLEQFQFHYERLNGQIEALNFSSEDINIDDNEEEVVQLGLLMNKLEERIKNIQDELTKLQNKYTVDLESERKKETDVMICYAKLLSNPFVVINDNCINDKHKSENLEFQINSILNEIDKIKFGMDNYPNQNILNFFLFDKIIRKTEPFNDTFNIIYITKEMKNGSIYNYLQKLPNRGDIYQFDDEFLLQNLIENLNFLNHMKRSKVSHNNIKPNNVLISEDGKSLIICDFCPKSVFVERCFKVYKKKANCPKFLSPELSILLTGEISLNCPTLSRKISEKMGDKFGHLDFANRLDPILHSNDVFCLGLVYYHLITLKLPYENELNYDDMVSELKHLSDKRDQKLIDLTLKMLEFDCFERLGFEELLNEFES